MVYFFCCIAFASDVTSEFLGPQPGANASLNLNPLDIDVTDSCLLMATGLLKAEGSLNTWTQIADPGKEIKLFRSPTTSFGKWVEIEISNKIPQVVRLITLEKVSTNQLVRKEKSCSSQRVTKSNPKFMKKPRNVFTDAQLKTEMRGTGLIYVWSPKMTYSMKHLDYFEQAAQNLKIKFIAVVDTFASAEEVKKAQTIYGIQKRHSKLLWSNELRMRQFYNHYPRTFVFSKGAFHPQLISGVKEKSEIIEEVRQRLREM